MSFEAMYRTIILDAAFGDDASSLLPSSYWVGLLDPEGVECTGTDYLRVEVENNSTNFPDAVGDLKILAVEVLFPAVGDSDWGTIGLAGLFDASTAGNLAASARVAGGILGALPVGVTPRIAANSLAFSW